MVETQGLEPWTPCLQSRCSSQLSYVPIAKTFSIVPYLFRYDKCIIVYMLYEFSVQSFFVGVLVADDTDTRELLGETHTPLEETAADIVAARGGKAA